MPREFQLLPRASVIRVLMFTLVLSVACAWPATADIVTLQVNTTCNDCTPQQSTGVLVLQGLHGSVGGVFDSSALGAVSTGNVVSFTYASNLLSFQLPNSLLGAAQGGFNFTGQTLNDSGLQLVPSQPIANQTPNATGALASIGTVAMVLGDYNSGCYWAIYSGSTLGYVSTQCSAPVVKVYPSCIPSQYGCRHIIQFPFARGGGVSHGNDYGPYYSWSIVSSLPFSTISTVAAVSSPSAVVVDPSGNLYIADRDDNRVRVVDAAGTITTFAGNGSAGFSGDGAAAISAQLNAPSALALDAGGNLYVADTGNNRVRRISPAGIITTVAGTGAASYSGDGAPAASSSIAGPQGLTVDLLGNLVLSTGDSRVLSIHADGTIHTVAGTGGAGYAGDGYAATGAELANPLGLVYDAAGNLYIADHDNSRIRQVTPSGNIFTVAGGNGAGVSGDGGAWLSAAIGSPTGLAIDSAGNLYFADDAEGRVRALVAGGTVAAVAGAGGSATGDGGYSALANLSAPRGLALDAAGNLYIADRSAGRIRRINTTAQVVRFPAQPNVTYPSPAFQLNAVSTAGSGAVISYAGGTPGICAVTPGGVVTVVGVGTCSVTAQALTASAPELDRSPVAQLSFQVLAGQSIALAAPPDVTFSTTPITLSATSSDGLGITYTSLSPQVCTVTGNVVTLLSAGSCGIQATQGGNATYAAAPPVWISFNVALALQTLTFSAPAAPTYGGAPVTLMASAGSGLPVTFTSLTPTVCSVSGALLTALGGGTCTVAADQAGNSQYAPATQVVQTVQAVASAPLPSSTTLSVSPIPGLTLQPIGLTATVTGVAPTGTVQFLDGSNALGGPVTLVGGSAQLTISTLTTGAHTLNAVYSGDLFNTPSSASAPESILALIAQTITFPAPGTQLLSAGQVVLAATSSSNLAVTYSSRTPAICTVSGSTVTLLAGGTCVIAADQPGNATYGAAIEVVRSFLVQSYIITAPSVGGGYDYSFVLRGDALFTWGQNGEGQLGNGSTAAHLSPGMVSLPAGFGTVSVAAGFMGGLALGANGSIYCWGADACGLGSVTPTPQPIALPFGLAANAIAARGNFYAIGSDGNLYGWGGTSQGSLGVGDTSAHPQPVPVPLPGNVGVLGIAVGTSHVLALGANGYLYTWGTNESGELGNGTLAPVLTPTQISLPGNITATAIAAGQYFSLAIGADGNLYSWGDNNAGQLGNGTLDNVRTPTAVPLPAGITPVAIAATYSVGLMIGADAAGGLHLYGWGFAGSGAVGDGTRVTARTTVTQIMLPGGISPSALGTSFYQTMVIGSDGQVYVWGDDTFGQLGDGNVATTVALPELVGNFPAPGSSTTALTATPASSPVGQAVTLTAAVTGTAPSGTVQFLDGSTALGTPSTLADGIAQLITTGLSVGTHSLSAVYSGDPNNAASRSATVSETITSQASQTITFVAPATQVLGSGPVSLGASASSGLAVVYTARTPAICSVSGSSVTLLAGGTCTIAADQPGNGTYGPAVEVLQSFKVRSVPGAAQAVTGGLGHTLLVRSGAVYAWGQNSSGQLGNGTLASRLVPGPVSLPSGVGVTAIAAEDSGGLALTSSGTVYCWGQCTADFLSPVVIGLPNGIGATAIAARAADDFAIGSNNLLYGWGINTTGQLGVGDTAAHLQPVQIALPQNVAVKAVAAGATHTLALDANGNIYAWGNNESGELGNGTLSASLTPVQVSLPGNMAATAIAAGQQFSLAIGQDGNLYSWGINSSGQLGNGTLNNATTPTRVTLTGITPQTIAATYSVGLLIGADSAGALHLYAWGNNSAGAVGNGTTTNQTAPAQVTLPGGVSPASLGISDNQTVVLGSDGQLYAWGDDTDGELGDGKVLTYASQPELDADFYAPGSSTTALGSTPATSPANQPVTLTATVTGTSPSGTVQFFDGAAVLGSPITLVDGAAQWVTSTLSVGTHALTVLYSGDLNNSASRSATVTETVTSQLSQTISFPTVGAQSLATTGTASVVLAAVSSSGLAVTYTSRTPLVCTVSGATVTLIGSGLCTIALDQSGNGTYGNAVEVLQSFLVQPAAGAPQTIAGGAQHTLLIRGGAVYAWGDNSSAQLGNGTTTTRLLPGLVNLPAGVSATAVAAADYGNIAIGSNGSLYCWGYGVCAAGSLTRTPQSVSLPGGITAAAVAARDADLFVIGSDGNLYGWGLNESAQLGVGDDSPHYPPPLVPIPLPGNVNVVAVAAGGSHTLALGANGNLYSWGINPAGEIGNGTRNAQIVPTLISLPNNVTATAIAAGNQWSLAIGADGNVYGWGYNAQGQLGNGTLTSSSVPTAVTLPAGITPVQIAATYSVSLMIGADSGGGLHLYVWGYNGAGAVGDGTTVNRLIPTAVALPNGVSPGALGTSDYQTLVLGSDGRLYAWGDDTYGELGDGLTQPDRASPYVVTSFPPPATVAVSPSAGNIWQGVSLTLTVNVTGSTPTGTVQLYDGATALGAPLSLSGGVASLTTAALGVGTHTITAEYGGDSNNLAAVSPAITEVVRTASTVTLAASPSTVTAGQNIALTATVTGSAPTGSVQFRDGSTVIATVTLSGAAASAAVSALAVGSHTLTAVYAGDSANGPSTSPGVAVTVNASQHPQSITFPTLGLSPLESAPFATGVSASSGLAVTLVSLTPSVCTVSGQSVVAVALGQCTLQASQAGNSSYAPATSVTQSFSITPSIAASGSHACLVGASHNLQCWGYGLDGSLGNGQGTSTALPVAVSGAGSGVAMVTVGANHACLLTSSGGVQCWGNNSYGQLGNSTTTPSNTPAAVPGLASGIVWIAAGGYHTCAITAGGALLCWGHNSFGQVGNGTTTDVLAPTTILANGVASVAGGYGHTCAVMTGGALQCWGNNAGGQLGVGSTTASTSPVAVAALPGVIRVAGGYSHTCAITTGGAAWCWGDNSYGQIGDGTTAMRTTPVAVSGLGSGVVSLANAGAYHTCALTSGGAVQCWGDNSNGQLGNSTLTNAATPQAVVGLGSGVLEIAAGQFFSCAVTGIQAYCWGADNYGQLGINSTTDSSVAAVVSGLTGGTAAQTINLPTIGTQPVSEGSFTLATTDSAGLVIAYASTTPMVCTVAGNTVTLLATGSCSITAGQAGNATYGAAASQTVSFNVSTGSGGGGSGGATDAPLPWWALAALGGGLLGVASRRRTLRSQSASR